MAIGREQSDVDGLVWLARPELAGSPGIAGIGDGLMIPWPVFAAMIAFGIGIFVGPALFSLSTGGQEYLKRAAERRFD